MSVQQPPPLTGAAGRIAEGISGVYVTDTIGGISAVDDGLRSYFAVTWTVNGTSLGIQTNVGPSGTGLVTVANTGPGGVAQLTIASNSTYNTGFGIQYDWIGKPIAIAGAGAAGGIFVAKVASVFLDITNQFNTAVLDRAVPTPLTGASQKLACPCFTDGTVADIPWNCVGNNIYLTVGSQLSGIGPGVTTSVNQVSSPLATTIATFVDPFTVTLAAAIKAASVTTTWNGTQITWGTDNRAAFISAANYAISQGQRALLFPGWTRPSSTGIFVAFNWQTSIGSSFTQTDQDAAVAEGTLIWNTQNAEVVILPKADSNGVVYDTVSRVMAVPLSAKPAPTARQEINGAIHLPNCAGKTSLVVCVTGDSWGAENPTGGANNAFVLNIIAAIRRQNPGVTVYVENRARGGTTWRMMSDPQAIGGGSNQFWVTDITKPWYFFMQNCVSPLGTVVPDIFVCMMNGNNDGGTLHDSEIDAFLNLAATWQTRNGKPPDILMSASGFKSDITANAGTLDSFTLAIEYGTTLTRNRARALHKGLFDWDDRSNLSTYGWSMDNLILKAVPPLASAISSATVPYCLQYLCRDFYTVLRLTGTSGTDFWSRAGLLRLRLSAKPDNFAVIGLDASNNLNVSIWDRGAVIPTPVTTVAGSKTLVTSGQTAITMQGTNTLPGAPTFFVSTTTNPFLSSMAGQCFLQVAAGQKRSNTFTDYSTHIMSFVSVAIATFADVNGTAGISNTSAFVGGWMFTVWDALAQSDIVIPGAGTTTHPFFGANCLVTKIVGYTDKNTVTLADAATTTLTASTQNVFVGKVSSQPSYEYANGAGTDAGANPIITFRKSGSRLRVGYIIGSLASVNPTDVRAQMQGTETMLWEGEIGGVGTPFVPQIWSNSVSGVTMQSIAQAVGERVLYQSPITQREAWGTPNTVFDYPYSGDTSHPSLLFQEHVNRALVDAQNFVLPFAQTPVMSSDFGSIR